MSVSNLKGTFYFTICDIEIVLTFVILVFILFLSREILNGMLIEAFIFQDWTCFL